jgi:hypothetical protein
MDWETVHLSVLAVTVVGILAADYRGFAYVSGIRDTLFDRTTRFLHGYIWLGLAGMVLSGVMLVLPIWEYYLSEPAFIIKLGFVGLLIWNGWMIRKLLTHSAQVPYAELPEETKRKLKRSGTLSFIGWVAATAIGFWYL